MRVLLINQVFYPDVAATAQHGHDLARDLVRHGHEVSAIASRSIYGRKGAALPSHETVDGIEIHRVGKSLFGKAGIAARVADFAIFYLAALLKALLLPRHDVVICFTTPPFIAAVGPILRCFKKTRFVYWVMDLYPDLPIACGVMKRTSLPSRFFESVNRRCLRSADADVVLGRCMADLVRSKGVSEDRIRLIGVWSDQEEVKPVPRERNPYREEWRVGDRVLVMYSGNFGIGHDVRTFLEAARRLRDDDRIRFAFVGGGKKKEEVEAFVAAHGLESTCILAPYQPRERLDELLSAADLHLVSLLEGVEGIMVPSKLFGILAAGRPALFIGDDRSEISRVVVENDCGSSVRQGDVDSLVEEIVRYADDPEARIAAGDRARRALVEEHGARHRLEAWRALLEELAGGDATSSTPMGATRS
ncbi:MAG: glycosyltransferase family 4 protein [Planctomycetota bacterium]|nr:glycosyltransferase family 4 protein [Planctomycetota bacterium]